MGEASPSLEEERLPWYEPDQFYPVHIGEIFENKYKVVGKLGYGAHSTVWLGRDIHDASFAALKMCTRNSRGGERELQFYEHVSSLGSKHPGQRYIRNLLGTFEVKGPAGDHLCLVHEPMHMTIRELQRQNSARRLNEKLLKWTLCNVLQALSFLHDDAGVVHTDINPANIMLTIDDQTLLTDFERAEEEEPSLRKVINDRRTIYTSRKLGLPEGVLWGEPVLCDFGEARIGQLHTGVIQPELYRAPEVLFNMGWSASVDIWNVAVLIWDIFEDRHLFNALDEENESSATHLIAEVVAYLGLPPLHYQRRSAVTSNVFDDKGQWKCPGGVTVPQLSLEDAELVLQGEEKQHFLAFVRSMLAWLPEDRKRATDLLKDPWMTGSMRSGAEEDL